MDLIINDKVIDAPLDIILHTLKREITTGKLREIKEQYKNDIAVTCPTHSDGYERHPSCNVFADRYDDTVEFGTSHCLSCGTTLHLPQFVEACFNNYTENFGNDWLVERFGTPFQNNARIMQEIKLKQTKQKHYLDESILNQYRYFHPYMWKRKLTPEIVQQFEVGYDPKTQMISFPVRDERNHLVMITYRSVNTKYFYIQKDIEKPIYLLNHILNNNIKTVVVTESQIDALTSWTYGHPAVAFMGVPADSQFDILNKSGIRNFITLFDNDEGGRKFTQLFNRKINKSCFVTNLKIPNPYKDINDMPKEEFEKLFVSS